MAFDATPTSWVASWSEDGTNCTFPLASLDEGAALTAAEADAVSGDWRYIVHSLIDHTYGYYNGLATADKPTKLTISKSGSLQSSGEMLYTYTVRVYVAISGEDVAAES